MDIEQLYQDYSVDYRTEGHKHTRKGWVNTECVWCTTDNPGYHLGYHVDGNFYTCWKCGWHPIVPTIARLLNMHEREAEKVVKQYGMIVTPVKKDNNIKVMKYEHRLPTNAGPLAKNHISYLKGRGFDAEQLERDWQLLGTGPVSFLEDPSTKKLLDYKHRIIIPFIWDGKQVSFDSRDITGKHIAKYMACPLEREKIPHKEILYGNQELWGDVGICVEGPTDTWRFGTDSFATSGIKYTVRQVRLMAGLFKKIYVCYDGQEKQALIAANQLVADLRFRGRDAERVDIIGDPGGMRQPDADKLVRKLIYGNS